MPRYIFYFINILFCISLQAQESENIFTNVTSIEKLSKGNLLVRLESKENKIRFLESAKNATDCNKKCKSDIQDQIEDVIHSRDQFNSQFIESFNNYFAFCPVYFYYDKDHNQLASAQFKGNHYLDNKLQSLNVTTINKDSILILKKDVTPNSENEGWLFQTADGVTLKNGFPFVAENSSKTFWTWLSSFDHLVKNCNYLVQKLNKSLYIFKDESKFGGDRRIIAVKGLNAFYISNKLDTVKVKINLPNRLLSSEIDYQSLQSELVCFDSLNRKFTLTPKMIKEFSFNYGGEKVRMISIMENKSGFGNDYSFLQLKIEGKLKLYFEFELVYRELGPGHGGVFQNKKNFVLQLENKPLLRFHSYAFRNDLIEYIKDCPELVEKIKNKLYDREDMEKIVYEYNSICGN